MLIEFVFAASVASLSPEELQQQVVCAETGFSRAAEMKDLKAFKSFIDPDARFVAGRVARGPEEIAKSWSFLFDNDDRTQRWRPKVVEVTPDGNLAISRGPYRARWKDDDGNPEESWGSYVSTWRRDENGNWKVLFDAEGYSGDEPSESDRAVLEADPECPESDGSEQ